MATPPSLIASPISALNTTTTPKSVASITTQVNDVIVVKGVSGDGVTILSTPTNTNTAQTYTLQQSYVSGSFCGAWIWTAIASVAQAMVVSIVRTGGSSNLWGFTLEQWRGSDGVGASNKAQATSAAPSVSVTTGQANSAVSIVNGDWNAVNTARTWRTVNGAAATETAYFADGANYGFYAGYHTDTGAAGANAYGLSAPSTQKYSLIAVEIKGAAAGGPTPPPDLIMQSRRAF